MAVVIWKNGERALCPPKRLKYQLDAGWSLTKGEVIEKAVELIDNSISSDESEVRAYGKTLGVKSAHNKKIEKVIAEIEEIETKAKEDDSD